jgi:hypothetical protein
MPLKLSKAALLWILWVTHLSYAGDSPLQRRKVAALLAEQFLLAGESGYAQAGGKLSKHPCLPEVDLSAALHGFFATLG